MITHNIVEAISLSDTVIVLSKRPAVVRETINIDLDKTPTKRRSDKKFSNYYEKIWKMIDKN